MTREGRLRILIISEFYDPDLGAGQRVAEAASMLASRGHSVRVLTRHRAGAHGINPRGNGIGVQRLWGPTVPGCSLVSKMLAAVCFLGSAFLRALLSRQAFDVLLTISTPPMCHVAGVIVSRLRRATHVFWCADLHPESLIASGALSANHALAGVLAMVNRWALQRCDVVIAVGRCMRQLLIARKAPTKDVIVVPMWHRDSLADPPGAEVVKALRAQLRLAGRFVVMYSGNLGRMHHFETLLAAADRLRGEPEFHFLFAGSGPALGTIRRQAEARGLRNLLIHSIFPESVLREALALASVHVITLRESAVGVSVPGKLYGILAAARPVIFLGPAHSEVALAIQEEQCGFVVPEHDTDCLVRLLRQLRTCPLSLQRLGTRARTAFLQRYRQSHACLQFCQEIERAARQGAAAHLVNASFGLNRRPSEHELLPACLEQPTRQTSTLCNPRKFFSS